MRAFQSGCAVFQFMVYLLLQNSPYQFTAACLMKQRERQSSPPWDSGGEKDDFGEEDSEEGFVEEPACWDMAGVQVWEWCSCKQGKLMRGLSF